MEAKQILPTMAQKLSADQTLTRRMKKKKKTKTLRMFIRV